MTYTYTPINESSKSGKSGASSYSNTFNVLYVATGVEPATTTTEDVLAWINTSGSGSPFYNIFDQFGSTAMFLRTIDVAPVEEGGNCLFEVVVTWDDTATGSASETTFLSRSINIVGEVIDVWRTDPDLPADIDDPSSLFDVGGFAIDINGDPVSALSTSISISITNQKTAWGDLDVAVAPYIGTRNSITTMGYAAGYLVFKGVNSSRIGPSLWEVTYEFIWDRWAHLRQVPRKLANNTIELIPHSSAQYKVANHVMWKQPFGITSNFVDLGISLA